MKPDEFIREVEEELQQERLQVLWKLYGPYVIAAALAIVLGTAGYNGWTWWQEQQRAATAQAWDEALNAPERADALRQFAESAPPGFATVARLQAAAALAEDDPQAAIQAYEAAAADASDPLLVDLARLQALGLRLASDDPATLVAELEPLAAAGEPFRHTAREYLASAHLRMGERDRAIARLSEIRDDVASPPQAQARASELIAALEAGAASR